MSTTTGAPKLTMARATVTAAGQQLATAATVQVLGSTATITDRLGNVLHRAEVTEVRRNSRRSSTLVLADGTEWVLTSGGCGCGGR